MRGTSGYRLYLGVRARTNHWACRKVGLVHGGVKESMG